MHLSNIFWVIGMPLWNDCVPTLFQEYTVLSTPWVPQNESFVLKVLWSKIDVTEGFEGMCSLSSLMFITPHWACSGFLSSLSPGLRGGVYPSSPISGLSPSETGQAPFPPTLAPPLPTLSSSTNGSSASPKARPFPTLSSLAALSKYSHLHRKTAGALCVRIHLLQETIQD